MARDHLHQPITNEHWNAIQDNAKAAARRALETGKTENLTALGWAYYDKYAFEESE